MPTKTAKTIKGSKATKTTRRTSSTRTSRATNVAEVAPSRAIEIELPESYTPISMWGYFAYQILFAIPLIGWIFCVAFAFIAKNYNLRNFARSQFCWLIIYVIIVCVLAGLGVFQELFELITTK